MRTVNRSGISFALLRNVARRPHIPSLLVTRVALAVKRADDQYRYDAFAASRRPT